MENGKKVNRRLVEEKRGLEGGQGEGEHKRKQTVGELYMHPLKCAMWYDSMFHPTALRSVVL